MKFTFKTEKPTGRYRSFFTEHHYVKLKKQTVGMIEDKEPHQIRLKVVKPDIMEDGNANCDWKWITLKAQFKTVEEAKEFLNANFISINDKWKLAMERE
jgi:hypothetical protein